MSEPGPSYSFHVYYIAAQAFRDLKSIRSVDYDWKLAEPPGAEEFNLPISTMAQIRGWTLLLRPLISCPRTEQRCVPATMNRTRDRWRNMSLDYNSGMHQKGPIAWANAANKTICDEVQVTHKTFDPQYTYLQKLRNASLRNSITPIDPT